MQLWSSQRSQNMTLHESIATSLFTQEQTAPCSSSTWILPQKKPQIQKETMISLLVFHDLSSRRQTQQISSHFPADGVHLFYFQVGLKYLEINQEIQRVEVRQLLRGLWDEPGGSATLLHSRDNPTLCSRPFTSPEPRIPTFQGTRRPPKVDVQCWCWTERGAEGSTEQGECGAGISVLKDNAVPAALSSSQSSQQAPGKGNPSRDFSWKQQNCPEHHEEAAPPRPLLGLSWEMPSE